MSKIRSIKIIKTNGDKKAEKEKIAYSLSSAAEMIGVSKGHLRNENKRGKLRLIKSGRRTLVTAEEIQRYISELPVWK